MDDDKFAPDIGAPRPSELHPTDRTTRRRTGCAPLPRLLTSSRTGSAELCIVRLKRKARRPPTECAPVPASNTARMLGCRTAQQAAGFSAYPFQATVGLTSSGHALVEPVDGCSTPATRYVMSKRARPQALRLGRVSGGERTLTIVLLSGQGQTWRQRNSCDAGIIGQLVRRTRRDAAP